MIRLKEILAGRHGYNLRERANIYTGMALGFLAPIAAVRYLMSPALGDDAVGEAIGWTASLVTNVGCSLAVKGVPLLYSTGIGAAFGVLSAQKLKRRRIEKYQTLERQLITNQ